MVTGFQDRMKGKSAIATQYQAQNTLFYGSALDNITASPTPNNTQAGALLIQNSQNRITTVAAAGDSVRLPPAVPGASIVITNDATTNAANVWPSSQAQGGAIGGDKINALAANASFSLTVALGVTIFYCFSAGTWRTK
jgi:hypothetical protein